MILGYINLQNITLPWNTPPPFISIRAPRGSCKISAFIDSRNLLECFTTSVARAQARNSHFQHCNGCVELQRGVICVTNGTGISFSGGEGGLFFFPRASDVHLSVMQVSQSVESSPAS